MTPWRPEMFPWDSDGDHMLSLQCWGRLHVPETQLYPSDTLQDTEKHITVLTATY